MTGMPQTADPSANDTRTAGQSATQPIRLVFFGITIVAAVFASFWIADAWNWRRAAAELSVLSDEEISARLAEDWPRGATADYLDTLSDRAMRLSPPDVHSATRAVEAALDRDPRRPFALARLAYLETVAAGDPTPKAIDAMEQSIKTCPVCDVDLMKWRLDYIYGQWPGVSIHLQQLAQEQVQILGDVYQEHDYVSELRYKAENANIPFEYNSIDKYLKPVD